MSRRQKFSSLLVRVAKIAPPFAIAGVLLSFARHCQTHAPERPLPDVPAAFDASPITHIDGVPVQPSTNMTIPYHSVLRGACVDDSNGQVFVFIRSAGARWHLLGSPMCLSNGWQLEVTLEQGGGTVLAVTASRKPSAGALDGLLRGGRNAVNLRLVACSVGVDHVAEDGANAVVGGHADLPPHYVVQVERREATQRSVWVPAGIAQLKGNGTWSALVPLRDNYRRGGMVLLRAVARPAEAQLQLARPIGSDELRVRAPEPEAHLVTVGNTTVADAQCADFLPAATTHLRVTVDASATLRGERVWLSVAQGRQRGNAVEQLRRKDLNQLVSDESGERLKFEVDFDTRADWLDFAVAVSDDVPAAGSQPVVTCRRTAAAQIVARR